MDTKERIIDEALTLFSQKGYGDVYVAQIASAVGIKAPSLYKHFKSKQEIFDALTKTMEERYIRQASSIGISGIDAGTDAELYKDISEEALIKIGTGLFLYFLHDDYMARFRKMLTLEQFRNPALSKIYTRQFYEDPMEFQSGVFSKLISEKKLLGDDPKLMALEFYSPIYMLLTVCDRDPSYEKTAVALIEKHIHDFNEKRKVRKK
ncbi:MAG: TetR/AcrR family transcriptional regulator [Clostridiales bacterium]|nr:TetR/AcrR family transcriptional regulator [Clostridiales bacterium]